MKTHTHPHYTSYTQRDLQSCFGREKLIKRYCKLIQQKVKKKPQKALIVGSFEGNNEKAFIVFITMHK